LRCIKCKEKAVIELRRHNAAYCAPHYLDFFRNQVSRNVRRHHMFTHKDRLLLAISGGKDSLALWDVLLALGYQVTGLHVDLGIENYSSHSLETTKAFAQRAGPGLVVVDLAKEYGLNVSQLSKALRRVACSGCGLSKRYIFNRVARERSFDVLVTGHNLDDEAATLLGNVLHWQLGYLARQSPVLESTHPRLVKKVKPLYTLTERETASYALLRGIEYVEEECPYATGASSILYKGTLNHIEVESPGSKQQFVDGFLQRLRPSIQRNERVELHGCARCSEPTTTESCAFCRTWDRALKRSATEPSKRLT
jgi:uncharacterized protein (TIGR00269 family)